MPTTGPDWLQMALWAGGAALIIMLLQRIPVVGRLIRFAISFGILAFLIFVLLQQAPYSRNWRVLRKKSALMTSRSSARKCG